MGSNVNDVRYPDSVWLKHVELPLQMIWSYHRWRTTALTAVSGADDFPGHPELGKAANEFLEDCPLDWKQIILPKQTTEPPPASTTSSQKLGKNLSRRQAANGTDVARKKARLLKNSSSLKYKYLTRLAGT